MGEYGRNINFRVFFFLIKIKCKTIHCNFQDPNGAVFCGCFWGAFATFPIQQKKAVVQISRTKIHPVDSLSFEHIFRNFLAMNSSVVKRAQK